MTVTDAQARRDLRDHILGLVDDKALREGWGTSAPAPAVPDDALSTQLAPRGFERLPLRVFGHSWSGGGYLSWWNRVATRLSSGEAVSKGLGGRTAADVAMMNLNPAYSYAWAAPHNGLCIGVATINDPYWKNGDAASLRSHREAWAFLVSAYSAEAWIAADSFTYGGAGWATETITPDQAAIGGHRDSTGGTWRTTSTPGDYADITATATEAGALDIVFIGKAAGSGVATVTEAGETLATIDLSATLSQDTPAVARIAGLTPGERALRVTLDSGSMTLDSVRVRAAAPPAVIALGEPDPMIPGFMEADDYARLAEMRDNLASACDGVVNATTLDLSQSPGWDPDYLRADGAHLDNSGQGWAADQVMRHLHAGAFVPDFDPSWSPA